MRYTEPMFKIVRRTGNNNQRIIMLPSKGWIYLLMVFLIRFHSNYDNMSICFLERNGIMVVMALPPTTPNRNFDSISNRLEDSNENPSTSLKEEVAAVPRNQNVGIDTSWEFADGLEGWAQATKTEMNADVFHMGGEVKIRILKSSIDDVDQDRANDSDDNYMHNFVRERGAHLDSPLMNILIGERQTFAFRYRFVGRSKFAKIRLRGSNVPDNIDHGLVDWGLDKSGNGSILETEELGFFNLYFPLHGDGRWNIGYAEIDETKIEYALRRLNGTITQIRFWPGVTYRNPENSMEVSEAPLPGNSFHIDWIRIVRAPIIKRVTGCSGEKYFWTKEREDVDAEYNIRFQKSTINDVLHHYRTEWIRRETDHFYAETYNCLWKGFERITIEGHNLGFGGVNDSGAPAHVYIDEEPCTYVEHDIHSPQEKITCLTPKLKDNYRDRFESYHTSIVEVRNGKLTGLSDVSLSLQYAIPPPKPIDLSLSNFASRSIDFSWKAGGSIWEQMTITGYNIKWKEVLEENDVDGISNSWTREFTVGNITTTTIRGLKPNTTYVFGVTALNENQNEDWSSLDLYGRRQILTDALEGQIEIILGHTLSHDVEFLRFDANSTQNHGPQIYSSSIGPTGRKDGEGHFGLILVGHANVENCNSTSFCCDSFDETTGTCMDKDQNFVCMGTIFQKGNEGDHQLPGFGKLVEPLNSSISKRFHNLFHYPCGPALRLTASKARQVGAAWYPRQMEVGEGFEANFTFRISNPSLRCNNMDDVYTHCRSRGGDGLAFVIQGEGLNALGGNGKALGYGGINNSIAIEFDTYFNYEENDPYENHVSIHTRGWRHPNNENHVYSLGHSNSVPDLTDGNMRIKIKYEPSFDISHLSKPSFVMSPHVSYFFENDKYHSGGLGDWGYEGLGLIHVYCQNMHDPLLTVPLHLSKTLNLNRGRAWIGFTASTGDRTFQVHDVLDFSFSSLRLGDKVKS